MKRQLLLILVLSILTVFSLHAQDADLANAPYHDPSLPIEERVEDLLSHMTLEEKIGQMTLVEIGSLRPEDVTNRYLGGVLSGGGGFPTPNTVEAWAERTDDLQRRALQTELGIPILYGVDAVHGHNNLRGATIYPHNIGLGAANNPELMTAIGQATACDMAATGIYWNYAPTITVPQDIRWGRTYEGYSQDTERVSALGAAYLRGLQGDDLSDPYTVAGTPKHYIADGGAVWGTSTTGTYQIDQGDAIIDEATLRAVHLPPYQAAIDAGAVVIMASFSSWNGVKMHGQAYLLTDVLKEELGFDGFIVSDWQGIDQIDPNFYTSVVTAINAGIDMNMVPYDYNRFIDTLTEAVEAGDVPLERIDDAVRRILRVKFALGLFEQPFSDPELVDVVGNEQSRELARIAAAQSAVLLTNENDALPISPDVETVLVAGVSANDLGAQMGGWTITWQGSRGAITDGTTILEAIEATVSADTEVVFDRFARFRNFTDEAGNPRHAEVGIVVIGEDPYAEGVGDRADLNLTDAEINLIESTRELVDTLVLVVISGRPLIITDVIDQVDAVVAAWLPGSEGQGVADVLFGVRPFVGTLSYYYPRDMSQVPLDALLSSDEEPLFTLGHGITTGTFADYPALTYTCGG